MKNTFADNVREVVKKIPKGETLTYKEVARKAGSSKAFRVVGSIMKANFDKSIPCHRVVRSDGKVGEYNRGGEKAKRRILLTEGALK